MIHTNKLEIQEKITISKDYLIPSLCKEISIKEDDIIHYDKHAGHGIQHKDKFYGVIKQQDVVLID